MRIIDFEKPYNYYFRFMMDALLAVCIIILITVLVITNSTGNNSYIIIFLLFIGIIICILFARRNIYYVSSINYSNGAFQVSYYKFNKNKQVTIDAEKINIDYGIVASKNVPTNFKLIISYDDNKIIQYPGLSLSKNKWTSEIVMDVYKKLTSLKQYGEIRE